MRCRYQPSLHLSNNSSWLRRYGPSRGLDGLLPWYSENGLLEIPIFTTEALGGLVPFGLDRSNRPTGSPSCVAFCSFGLNWHLLACAGILTFWNIKFIQPPIKPTSRVTFNGQMWGIFIHQLSVEKVSLCVQSCLPMFFVYISGLLSVIVMTR